MSDGYLLVSNVLPLSGFYILIPVTFVITKLSQLLWKRLEPKDMNQIHNGAGREQPWGDRKFSEPFEILRIRHSNVNWTGCSCHLIHSRGA